MTGFFYSTPFANLDYMFRTPVSIKPVDHPISLNSRLLSWGSCFADFIGGQLLKNKFNITSNPFGVIFHPLAQLEIFKLALTRTMPPENSYVNNQGIWYNYFFHSSVSHHSHSELKSEIKRRITRLEKQLRQADFLLLTFGTAIQYQHKKSGLLVANCHKIPQKEFRKGLATPESIAQTFKDLLLILDNEPSVILSVSPIRHLKEGIENNSVSKAVLRVACKQIIDHHPEIHYFPGFEIMMDDLRDYRFFEKDMIHPNETAREYIWDIFKSNYLDRGAQKFVDQWSKISKNLDHRPFHPHSAAYQEFINKTLAQIEKLPQSVDTSKEVEMLKKNLI